jgi:uncharacterized Zn finger protein
MALLQHPGGSGYQEAVERLRQVRDLMNGLGRPEDFAAYLATVRGANKRRRNFMRLLEAAKLA